MAIKADRWIALQAQMNEMIVPFSDRQERSGIISYGLSSYGYDIRVAREFKVFTNVYNVVVDPKHFNPRSFVDIEGDYCDIPPNSFALARSVERLKIPRNVSCLVIGKSTYARCGIIVNITPLEPEWEGYITIEISNTTPLPARIYANEGIGQVLFFEGDEPCDTSYADKQGKYQNQIGIVLPRIDDSSDAAIRAFAERLALSDAFSEEESRVFRRMVEAMPSAYPLRQPILNAIAASDNWYKGTRRNEGYEAYADALYELKKALEATGANKWQ